MRFWSVNLLVAFIAFVVLVTNATTLLPSSAREKIRARMVDVDDIGYVLVINKEESKTVLKCAWSSGTNGTAAQNIEDTLIVGDNLILFVLYNKTYDGGWFFQGGKWSFQFSLDKNGKTVWSKAEFSRNNTQGIKYWKALTAQVSSSGTIVISEHMDQATQARIENLIRNLEKDLNKSAGMATPFSQ